MSSNPANNQAQTTLSVRVQPGARCNAIEWVKERGWLVRVAAPPVDGKANEQLCTFLAREVMGIQASAVRVFRGASGRQKVLQVDLGAAEVDAALQAWILAHA